VWIERLGRLVLPAAKAQAKVWKKQLAA
jgi:hypothetical protein